MNKFYDKYLKGMIYGILLISLVIFTVCVYMVELLPSKYFYALIMSDVVIGIISSYLIFYRKPKSKRSIITQIISMILSCVLVLGSFYIYKFGKTVDLLTETTFQKRAISVIVLNDSRIKNENQIPKNLLGYTSSIDENNMNYAVSE